MPIVGIKASLQGMAMVGMAMVGMAVVGSFLHTVDYSYNLQEGPMDCHQEVVGVQESPKVTCFEFLPSKVASKQTGHYCIPFAIGRCQYQAGKFLDYINLTY